MAKYSVELRTIVDSGYNLFDFEYDFYDNSKKAELQQRFIDHFYFREIGCETVGRFHHYLKCKFHETLPYYSMLLKTSLIDYDLINNYNLTETFKKTTSGTTDINGNTRQTGNTSEIGTNRFSAERNTEGSTSGGKTNTLDSTTEHTNTTDFTKDEDITEAGTLDNTTTNEANNKKVSSDTPSSLLSMVDIKNNVYASHADIEDNSGKSVDAQKTSATKKGKNVEQTKDNTKDIVSGTSKDNYSDSRNEFTEESNSTNTTGSSNFLSNGESTQSQIDNGSEEYVLERVGNIGVDKPSDMLLKHVEFQKILTTVYTQFFNECEDLFMQIF